MPFTLSHTVAAVPIKKYLGDYGVLSALIIGAMVPDFIYMLPNFYIRYYVLESHHIIGLFKICLPLGIMCFYIYHLLMAPVLVSAFPKALQRRLPPHLFLGHCPPANAHGYIVSLFIGSLTHLIWDSFTKEWALPKYISFLSTPLGNLDGHQIMPFRVIQHSSTILGLALLLWWIWRWYQRTRPDNTPPWSAPLELALASRTILVIFPLLAGAVFAYLNFPQDDKLYGLHSLQLGFKRGLATWAGTLAATCILLGMVYQLCRAYEKRRDLRVSMAQK